MLSPIRASCLALALWLLTGPALADNHYAPKVTLGLETRDWQAPHFADSPLVGAILDAEGQAIDEPRLLAALFRSRFVLLGEVHPNADHHALQARVLKELTVAGRRPAVVLEMVPPGLQAVLDAANEMELDQLGHKLAWEKRGWPAWEIYRPIFEVARRYRLPLIAGDLAGPRIRALARGAATDRPAELGLDEDLPPALQERLLGILFDSHCGYMPKDALGGMALAQRARDGALARAMIEGATRDGAVLIAGAGHLDRDLGVPRLLQRWAPEASWVSLAFAEVMTAEQTAEEVAKAGVDYVIATPRQEIKDHCAELAEHFGQSAQ